MIKFPMVTIGYVLVLGLFAPIAVADVPDYDLSFGPYVGGGSQSNGATVRHSSGFKASLDRRFILPYKLTVSPRVEVGNGIVSTKDNHDGHKILSTYDNRFFVGGIKLGRLYGSSDLTDELYFTLLSGFAQSKLDEEESADNTFIEKHYHEINGRYSVAEAGAKIQLRRNFSLDLAVLAHLYEINQEKAKGNGNIDGSVATEKGTFELTTDEEKSKYDNIDSRLIQRSLAATLGISLGF